MTTSAVAIRPAISKHALTVAAPVASPAVPMPVSLPEPRLEVVPVQTDPQWAPIRCHTVLPAKRFRLR